MSSSNIRDSGGQLDTALEEFESVLTPEQKERLRNIAAVPDTTAIIAFTTQLDNENAKRRSRCVASRLLTFLQSIQQFTTVVDTFVSSNPAIPALVWGSVKLAVLLTSNNATYFDKLSALFMSFSKHCPRYSEYQALYADSVGLRVAVCNFYAVAINCCTQAVQVISKSEPRGFWRPFKTDELGRFEKEIRECKSEVDAEIYRALHETILQEQQLQLIDRKAAARHRDIGSIFHARVDKSNEDEKRWRIQMDERQARTRKQELLDRLSDYDHITPLRRASMKQHGQTAGWLIESTEFENWMVDSKSSMFVLSGKLGSGKTVATACTVGNLFAKSGNDYRVVYFFCQFDKAESLSASKILSALVRQFLDITTLPESVETSLVNLLKVPCPEARDLGILLKEVLVIAKCSFIFIDAIDECAKPDWELLLKVLQNIMISCSSIVKIFLAVRQGIVDEMKQICRLHYQATMSVSEVNTSIQTYIEDILAERTRCGKLNVGNPQLIDEITTALVQGANGMLVCCINRLITPIDRNRFLWVAFQIEDLCHQVCDRDIRETIQKLPQNLPETYNRILSRIFKTGNAKLAKKIFPWIAIARRPLLLEELREAIAVEPLQPFSDPTRLVNDMSQIVSRCGNLIVLDEQDGTVQFTHQTVKMFLLDTFWDQTNADFHFGQRESNHHAGEICVTYLNFNDFKSKLIRQPKDLILPTPEAILRASLPVDHNSTSMSVWKKVAQLRKHRSGYNLDHAYAFTGEALNKHSGVVRELQTEHPFVSYAARYWLHHSVDFERKTSQSWHLWERLLYSEDGPAKIPWESSEWSRRSRTISHWICEKEHIALLSMIESSETPFSREEMQYILSFAIERPSLQLFDYSLRKWHNVTSVLNGSLIIAAGGGHLWAIHRLLAENANPNWRTLSNQGLQSTTINNHLDTKPKNYVGLTALQAAAMGGYLESIYELLLAEANINADPYKVFGRTALQAAAGRGHLIVVIRLLIAKADVNASAAQSDGRTALQAAAEIGHLEIVERLLTARADVNARAAQLSGRTALQAAAGTGQLEVVERLLAARADVNAEAAYHFGRTALQAAAENGHLEVVERLLIARAYVNVEAGFYFGRTALQAAAGTGHLEVVERLLAASADVNAKAAHYSGRTALQAAAEIGHLEIVERLLIAKANVNAGAAEDSGRTALQAAAGMGHLKVVLRLLTARADVNAIAASNSGRTALQAAAERGNLKIVERLLTAKANVNAGAAEKSGRTALQAAAGSGHLGVVERLLKAKADVNTGAVKHSGRTALQAAAEMGHLKVVERLLTARADVNAIAASHSGRTALQAAAENGHLEVVERLLTGRADVNAVPGFHFGRTALQAASGTGHLEVVERLLAASADVNAKAAHYSGRTALQAAAEIGHLEIVERLLIAKAAVNAEAAEYVGRTALQAAAGSGHLEVVEKLLLAKADVNARATTNCGRTALQAAAEIGDLGVVERLLRAKADVNAAGAPISGRTALHAAVENGRLEVVETLLTANPAYYDVKSAYQTVRGFHDEKLNKLLKSAIDRP